MSQRFPGKRLTLLFNKVKSPTRRLPPSAFIPLSNFPCCIWYCWCFSFFLSEKWIVVVSCSKRGSGLSPSCCLSYLVHRSWSGLSRYQASACSWAVGADKNGEGWSYGMCGALLFHILFPRSSKKRQEVACQRSCYLDQTGTVEGGDY